MTCSRERGFVPSMADAKRVTYDSQGVTDAHAWRKWRVNPWTYDWEVFDWWNQWD